MKKKKVLGILLVIVVLFLGIKYCSGQTSVDKLKEGDLIFHTSKSEQSPLIQYATMSVLSHCGIIIEKRDGLYVLEATGKLKLTPLQDFINRGKFKPDNNLFYCSELLHHIYKTQFGIELCKYRKVSDYHLTGLKKTLKKRGINLNQEVVAPIDIYNSKQARNI